MAGHHLSHLLQSVVQLHGSEQEALLAPQSGADLLAHDSQLAALWPNGVLCIVGVIYEYVAFTGQGQSTVQYVLSKTPEGMEGKLFPCSQSLSSLTH